MHNRFPDRSRVKKVFRLMATTDLSQSSRLALRWASRIAVCLLTNPNVDLLYDIDHKSFYIIARRAGYGRPRSHNVAGVT